MTAMTPSELASVKRPNKYCLENRQPNIFAPYTIGRAYVSRIKMHTVNGVGMHSLKDV
jgi:hypothetical protein